MKELHFFDCNSSFGMREVKMPFTFHTKQELLERMTKYGIDSALTHHAFARELNALDGNKMLIDEIRNESRLSPLWVVMPHHTGEFPAPNELINEMKQNGVRAVTMFSSLAYYYFSLSDWNCGELLNALEEHQIPLFIAMSNFDPDFESLYQLLRNHPALPVVLTNVTYRVSRNVYPLLSKFSNLSMESFGFKPQDGIEDFCSRFGAERLLFGSGMPVASGAAAVAMITYANISQEEKQLIAADNLERLLGGVKL